MMDYYRVKNEEGRSDSEIIDILRLLIQILMVLKKIFDFSIFIIVMFKKLIVF